MNNLMIAIGTVAVFVLIFSNSFAETIYLKTGKKVRGQVLEKNDQQIKVDISGVKITYFMDEVDHIEGVSSQYPSGMVKPEAAPAQPTALKEPSSENVPQPLPSTTTTTRETAPSLLVPTVSSVPVSPVTEVKKVLILELVEASGTKDTMSQMFEQIISQAPEDQVSSLKKILDINEIISRLVPIYDKYFSEEELKELIAFYKGTTGRKLIQVMPLIMEDSMNASEAYFQEKMPALEGKQQ